MKAVKNEEMWAALSPITSVLAPVADVLEHIESDKAFLPCVWRRNNELYEELQCVTVDVDSDLRDTVMLCFHDRCAAV